MATETINPGKLRFIKGGQLPGTPLSTLEFAEGSHPGKAAASAKLGVAQKALNDKKKAIENFDKLEEAVISSLGHEAQTHAASVARTLKQGDVVELGGPAVMEAAGALDKFYRDEKVLGKTYTDLQKARVDHTHAQERMEKDITKARREFLETVKPEEIEGYAEPLKGEVARTLRAEKMGLDKALGINPGKLVLLKGKEGNFIEFAESSHPTEASIVAEVENATKALGRKFESIPRFSEIADGFKASFGADKEKAGEEFGRLLMGDPEIVNSTDSAVHARIERMEEFMERHAPEEWRDMEKAFLHMKRDLPKIVEETERAQRVVLEAVAHGEIVPTIEGFKGAATEIPTLAREALDFLNKKPEIPPAVPHVTTSSSSSHTTSSAAREESGLSKAAKEGGKTAEKGGKNGWVIGGIVAAVVAIGAFVAVNKKKSHTQQEDEQRAETASTVAQNLR